MKTRICLCIALTALVLGPALCADDDMPTRTVNIDYTFDERGDALLEISFQHTAARWNQWKEAYGDHPDMMLRNLRYQFASAALEDFTFQKDDVHRSAVSKIKARALARYRGNGEFIIDVPKDMKLVTGSGTEWAFTSTGMADGEILSQTVHAKLPAKAANARYGPGGDFDQLTYSIDIAPARSGLLMVFGIILLVLGGVFAVASFLVGPNTTRAPIKPPPPHPPQGQPPLPDSPA
jgi:hypothetical protein